ncbi:MAG: 3'-5' exonuclease [Planctomycetes bacterium]|nr:3'-5' exonuclease [Planctomycetota bacterium]
MTDLHNFKNKELLRRVAFIDCETGGLDPEKHSLLSVGIVLALPEGFQKFEIGIRHAEYYVQADALKVNGINLIEHEKSSVPPKAAVEKIIEFCSAHLLTDDRWLICGHNIHFDVGFLKPFFHSVGVDFEKYFSHRMIDTSSILRFLYFAGVLDADVSSSNKAFDHFKIEVEGRHTALGDALATCELFLKLTEVVVGSQ